MLLGNRIKEQRKARKWTQDDVAAWLGVTKQSVSGWERNKISPSQLQLVRLADIFNLSIDYLLKGQVSETDRLHLQLFRLRTLTRTNATRCIMQIAPK